MTEAVTDTNQAENQIGSLPYDQPPAPVAGDATPPVEVYIGRAIERLRFFQDGPLACAENDSALDYLGAAMKALETRTERRRDQGVLGTQEPHVSP